MSQSKRSFLDLWFANGKVTEDVMPDLLSFSYTDNESMKTDSLSLSLMDPKGKWAGRFRPNDGEVVNASITPADVLGTAGSKFRTLSCGTFYVDSFRASGAPRTCEISAVSVPLDIPIRRKTKTRAWEKKSLKSIAGQLANENKLTLLWDVSDNNPTYDREDQKRESDLSFLMRLCENAGLSLKVTDKKLVIFDQASYEKKKPVRTLTLGESDVLSWEFTASVAETYKSVTVKYRDPKKSNVAQNVDESIRSDKAAYIEYTYVDDKVDSSGQEYEMKTRAKTYDEAKRLAKAKLRSLNRRSVTGSMSLVGDIGLVAGVVVTLKGFGSFDGNFVVEQAVHALGSSGYTTGLSLRRVNTKY